MLIRDCSASGRQTWMVLTVSMLRHSFKQQRSAPRYLAKAKNKQMRTLHKFILKECRHISADVHIYIIYFNSISSNAATQIKKTTSSTDTQTSEPV